ncbi:hypothetical protein [Spirosoma knui]
MKTKIVTAFAFALLFSAGAYAQDTTSAMTKKEIRRLERAERKAKVKSDLKNAGQHVGDAASELGQGAKENAKEAGQAISTGAKKAGAAIDRGVDKAGNAIQSEADHIKARRDSIRAAKRDTL